MRKTNSYTIFDHAQRGHEDRPVARKRKTPEPKKYSARPRKAKWFDDLGLGPQFNKATKGIP